MLSQLSDIARVGTTTDAEPARAVQRGVAGRTVRLAFGALAFGPYRTFFLAGLVFNSSGFVFNAALGWLVIQTTGSATSVGFVSFLYSLPFALLTLHAGLLADRIGARAAFAISLAASGIGTIVLGALVLTGQSTLALVAAGAFVIGALSALGAPGSISIVNDLVPAPAVSSGISLLFLGLNIGRIVGGTLAGVMLSYLASGWTILIAGLLLTLSALPIWRLPGPASEPVGSTGMAFVGPLVEAARYALRSPVLGVILVLATVPGAVGLAYTYLLPIAAVEIGAGADGFGILLASAGAGGLIAGITGEALMRVAGHGRVIFIGLGAVSAGFIWFGIANAIPNAATAMVLAGFGFVVYASASLSVIQALSPPDFRGRLTALFALLYWGLMPLGSLLGGAATAVLGASMAFAVAGLILIMAGIVAYLVRGQIAQLLIGHDGLPAQGGP
jgi:MFS family permease